MGGILGPIDWRLVFLVSVPVGLFGTVWSWMKLEERGIRQQARIDWWGNITFALGLIAVLVAITYGIQPYGGHVLGWTNPRVVGAMVAGLALLAAFVVIEMRTEDPMFRLSLFRIRAFSFGNIATLLASLGRGGLMFMLIIWLQGIWLPLHGYSFEQTPLWAGVYMLPLTVGFLIAGPTSGLLSDRFGARPFATGGMLIAALSFYLLERLPVNFGYPEFAALLVLIGIGMGLFTSPNQAGIMNSLPPNRRGAGAGMATTFQNSALVLSIGIFFTLMVLGLAGSLPGTLDQGLTGQGRRTGRRPAHLAAAAGRPSVLLVPRLQPDAPAAGQLDQPPQPTPGRLPDQPPVLPPADRQAVRAGPQLRPSTSPSSPASQPPLPPGSGAASTCTAASTCVR